MSQELTTTAAANAPAAQWNTAQIDIIKKTLAPGISNEELALFGMVCERTGLDPFTRQIYAIMRRSKADDGKWEEHMTIQTGIDGYRLTAARTEKLAGIDDAAYGPDVTDADGFVHPAWARVTVYRMIAGQRCPFTATARWNEYVQKTSSGSPTKFWKNMPFGQLGKCAEALALRKAFPAELSGIYTREEMTQASNDAPGYWVTADQMKRIRKACQQLGYEQPTDKDFEEMTADDAQATIDEYRREWTARQTAQIAEVVS